MDTNLRKELLKKLLAVALALTVGVTFIPLLGDSAFAEGETPDNGDVSVDVVPEGDEVDGVIEEEPSDVIIDEDQTEAEPADDEALTTDPDVDVEEAAPVDDKSIDEVDENALSALSAGETLHAAFSLDEVYSVSVVRRGMTVTVNATIKAPYNNNGMFRDIYVDDVRIASPKSSAIKNYTIKLSNPSAGYHSVKLTVYTVSTEEHLSDLDPVKYYRVGLLRAPSSRGQLAVYHNYLDFMSSADPNLINYKLFVEYSANNGRTWKRYGPMNYLQTYKIAGLRANTNYKLRSYYGVYRNGTLFTGKEEGKVLNFGTYRTGMGAKPAVKSIKVKAYKVKKKKQKIYGYYTGLYLGKRTYYKYKLKIEVKLKKKPGTNGIWINGKKYKGNKKKYTVKLGSFTSYSKPKGKKFKVAIYTYYNGSYGGYSPMYIKTKKIK